MPTTQPNAIITGAASGLGRALAVQLAADGWHIALADVDRAGSEQTLDLVKAAGGAGRVESLDVTRLDDWSALRDRLRADWPRLDLLVNNAGLGSTGDLGQMPLDEWRRVLDVNLYGAIYGCHTLVDWLKANPNGAHIINVASFAALAPSPSMAAYNVSKAGIVALSETLYGELKPHRVGVTVVCPMYFRTNITASGRFFNKRQGELIRRRTEQSTTTAEDVARAAIRSMRRRELYAIPGRPARWYWLLRRLSPRGFLDGIARDIARDAARQPQTGASDKR
jgi:NAD(P)-dependent dehydrogenase (short-subunit alcohol dehydrogenase family)